LRPIKGPPPFPSEEPGGGPFLFGHRPARRSETPGLATLLVIMASFREVYGRPRGRRQ
jgi:hypothetical protein